MFTTLTKVSFTLEYRKSVFDRYFHKWENAKKVMDDETAEMQKSGWAVIDAKDWMNTVKGFYEYEKVLKKDDTKIHFALIGTYFADED